MLWSLKLSIVTLLELFGEQQEFGLNKVFRKRKARKRKQYWARDKVWCPLHFLLF